MTVDWKPVRKIGAAIAVAAVIDTGALVAALSGALSWREAGLAMLAAALPVLRGYLVPGETVESPPEDFEAPMVDPEPLEATDAPNTYRGD